MIAEANTVELTQEKLSKMSLREKFEIVYGKLATTKFKYDSRGVNFIRIDAVKVPQGAEYDLLKRAPRPAHYRIENNKVVTFHTINFKGFNMEILLPKNQTRPRDEKGNPIYTTLNITPRIRAGRAQEPFFVVTEPDRYYYLMLSPMCVHLRNLKDENNQPVIFGNYAKNAKYKIYDPNEETRAELEKRKEDQRAIRRLAELSLQKGAVDVLAYIFGIRTHMGAVKLDEETLSLAIQESFTRDTHRPPQKINVNKFMQITDGSEFRYTCLAYKAMQEGVVKYDQATTQWELNVTGPNGSITEKTPCGKFKREVHGTDTMRPLINFLCSDENADIRNYIEKQAGYRVQPISIADDIAASRAALDAERKAKSGEAAPSVTRTNDPLTAEMEEEAYLREQLKIRGLPVGPNTRLKTLRERASENGIAPFSA